MRASGGCPWGVACAIFDGRWNVEDLGYCTGEGGASRRVFCVILRLCDVVVPCSSSFDTFFTAVGQWDQSYSDLCDGEDDSRSTLQHIPGTTMSTSEGDSTTCLGG